MSGRDPIPNPQAYEGVRAVNPPEVILAKRAPDSGDRKYRLGTIWINTLTDTTYQLTSITAAVPNWQPAAGPTLAVQTLTGTTGGAISPVAGDIDILGTAVAGLSFAGTAGAITGNIAAASTTQRGTLETSTDAESVTGSSAIVAVTPASLTARFAAPGAIGGTTPAAGTFTTLTSAGTASINATGAAVTTIGTGGTGAVNIGNATGNTAVTGSLTTTTSLTATLGAITATNGNLVLGTAGNKILSTSVGTTTAAGANSFGTVTLTAGTATVSTTAVTANSIVFLTRQTIGATGAAALGIISRGTIVAGTSFVINALLTADATALATTDVSSVGWMIVN